MPTTILLALWKRPETTLQNLLAETGIPLPASQTALQKLRDRGCRIEETPTTLRLVSVGLPCWQDILEHIAATENLGVGRRVQVFARTASTNDRAWQAADHAGAARSADNHGLVVLADEQSAGRGRFGHTWESKPQQSILLSLLLVRSGIADSLDRLTLLAGLAAARAVEEATLAATGQRLRIHIKWPNDLLVDGKKLAGILVERRGHQVVVGIGINVAQMAAEFPPEIAAAATSIYLATGTHVDRLRIIAALLRQLDAIAAGPIPKEWLADWKSRCSMLGTRIRARSGSRLIAGQVIDIDPLQGLVLRDDAGATHFLSAPTTTLTT